MRLIIVSILLIVAIMAMMMLSPISSHSGSENTHNTNAETNHEHAMPKDRTYGKALIGGDFTLTNQAGETFSNKDLLGKYSLVFLGFTHCPAICPTAMLTVTNAMNQLDDKADEVVPVFISVDPERDTPARLKEYMANYHPSIVALTGTEQEIKDVAAAYKAYYAAMTPDETGNYDMSHSSFLYLMDRNGEYTAHFPHSVGEDVLVEEITKRLSND